MQAWKTKQWKENKKRVMKDKCQWCGSKENLVQHHEVTTHDYFKKTIRYFLVKAMCKELKLTFPGIGIFSQPNAFKTKERYVPAKEYRNWVDSNYETMIAMSELAEEATNRWYVSLEGTITVCNRCHFLFEKKGIKLCQNCKKNYHRTDFVGCYKCNKESERLGEEMAKELKNLNE